MIYSEFLKDTIGLDSHQSTRKLDQNRHIQLLMNISSELDKFAKKEFGFLLMPFEN